MCIFAIATFSFRCQSCLYNNEMLIVPLGYLRDTSIVLSINNKSAGSFASLGSFTGSSNPNSIFASSQVFTYTKDNLQLMLKTVLESKTLALRNFDKFQRDLSKLEYWTCIRISSTSTATILFRSAKSTLPCLKPEGPIKSLLLSLFSRTKPCFGGSNTNKKLKPTW